MKYLVDIPRDVSDRLRRYADDQRQTVEEIIATLLERDVDTLPPFEPAPPTDTHTDLPPPYDPWAGFHGAFEAISPDALDQHDLYLAMEAIDPHAEEETLNEQDNADERR